VNFPLPGDLDVVAFLNDGRLVMVECKSSGHVDEVHCSLFLQRVQAFHPDLAILLIDTPAPFSQDRIAACNAALHQLGYPKLRGSRGFYRGVMNVYMINVAYSIGVSLNDVLRFDEKCKSSSGL
jgi:hypothetical protein